MGAEEKTPEQSESELSQANSGDSSDNGDLVGEFSKEIQAISAADDPVDAQLAELANDESGVGDVLSQANTVSPEEIEIIEATALGGPSLAMIPPPIASNFEHMSANGGAVGALVLGVWCVAGSFITNWSMINGFLGLILGLWGLASRKKKTAWIGILLCLIGVFMCLLHVSELVNTYLNADDEAGF